MKNIKKIVLALIVLLASVILYSPFSNAANATVTADSESSLTNAIENASNGDIIELSTDISLTSPIEIKDKTITIDGKGHSISKNVATWNDSGANATLITAGMNSNVTLSNLTLRDSKKYGAQAYNGGYLILDNVIIYDCAYGGVIVNAGTLEIRNLSLRHNGKENSNNGIEIGKGKELDDSYGTNQPKLIMNGVLTSTETENVIYLASNDYLTEFSVETSENSQDKLFIDGNKVVVANENNEIKFESNENEKIQIEGTTYTPDVTITINLNGKTTTVSVAEGTTLTKNELISKIDLKSLGLNNYSIVDFYTNEDYSEKFDFNNPITTDTIIYAKLQSINQSDNTPKTGSNDTLSIWLFMIVVSSISLIALKNKNI